MPGHKYILSLEHLEILLIGPHVYQHFTAYAQYSMHFRYCTNSQILSGKMMHHRNRNYTIKHPRSHRQLQRITVESFTACYPFTAYPQQVHRSISSKIENILCIHTQVLAISTPHITIKGTNWQFFKVSLDFWPGFVTGVRKMGRDFIVDVVNVTLFHICCVELVEVRRVDLGLFVLVTSNGVLLFCYFFVLGITQLRIFASTRILLKFPKSK